MTDRPTTTEHAVLERIIDEQNALLLIGDPPERRQVVLVKQLPDGAREGTPLRVQFEADQLLEIAVDLEEHNRLRTRDRTRPFVHSLHNVANETPQGWERVMSSAIQTVALRAFWLGWRDEP